VSLNSMRGTRTLFEIMKWMEEYQQTDEEFLTLPSSWEQDYEKQYGSLQFQRRMVLRQSQVRPPELKEEFKARWKAGFFCSVGTQFVLLNLAVPVGKVLPAYGGQRFEMAFTQQPELNGPDTTKGEIADVTLDEMISWRWGLDGDAQAMRKRWIGTPILRASRTQVTANGWASDVPDTYPIDLSIWGKNNHRVIRPYGLPQTEYMGLIVRANPWFHPLSLGAREPGEEGAMVLTKKGEKRIKWSPTAVIDATQMGPLQGLWEFRREVDGRLTPLRPRPTKIPVTQGFFFTHLSLSEWTITAPVYYVEHKTMGPFVDTWEEVEDTLFLDSGYRVRDAVLVRVGEYPSYPRSVNEDVITYMVGSRTVLVPVEVVQPSNIDLVRYDFIRTGVKAIIVNEVAPETVYLIKDGEKQLDFIGGTIEPFESANQALYREIKEETGIVYTGPITSIGVSSVVDRKTYHAIIKVIDYSPFKNCPLIKETQQLKEDCAGQVPRIYDFYKVELKRTVARVKRKSLGYQEPTIGVSPIGKEIVRQLQVTWARGGYVDPRNTISENGSRVQSDISSVTCVVNRGITALMMLVRMYTKRISYETPFTYSDAFHYESCFRREQGLRTITSQEFMNLISLLRQAYVITGLVLPHRYAPFLDTSWETPIASGGYEMQEILWKKEEATPFTW